METDQSARSSISGILVASHVVLATLMCAWRAIESTPGTASVTGGAFASSPVGRVFGFASVLLGVLALVGVLVRTFLERRDWRALVLAASLVSALASRKTVDVFDLVYVAFVAIVTTLVFVRRRSRPVETMMPPSGSRS